MIYTPRNVSLLLGTLLLAACNDASIRKLIPPAFAGAEVLEGAEAPQDTVPSEPAIPDPRQSAPEHIRGIYLTAYTAGSATRLPQLLELAARTELNTFVVDMKTEQGIHYRSEIPLGQQLARQGHVPIRDLKALADTLHAHGIHTIARIVVFKDPILSKAKPEWSIKRPDGSVWVDKAGNTWVSAWEPAVWEYNLQIAEEAARAGWKEIQFDYIRFPEPYKSLPPQIHPKAKGSRTDAIQGFLAEAKRRIHPLGATVAADVFGLAMNESRDVGIGQQWEALSGTVDHILPMVYPSHYFPTHLRGVPRPNRMPYETVYTSVGMGVIRNQRIAEAGARPARIIPWLQAFSAPWVDKNFPYGPEQARAQIKAVHDLGLEDWIFWDPFVRYERMEAGFAPATASRGKPWQPSAEMVSIVDRFDREGAEAERERIVAAAGGAPFRPVATQQAVAAQSPVVMQTPAPPQSPTPAATEPKRESAAAKPQPKASAKPKPKPSTPRLLGVPVQPAATAPDSVR
ncbi:hypothetical protein BH23GEM5_BH23GEM5_17340 [soil metagenome]